MADRRLLIVEDDLRIVQIVQRVADEMKFTARHTVGTEFKAAYHNFRPTVIILDIFMPEVDGLEVLEFLKQQPEQPHIIILSGSPDAYRRMAETLGNAFGLYIDANISKPFRISDLRKALKEAIAEPGMPDALHANKLA